MEVKKIVLDDIMLILSYVAILLSVISYVITFKRNLRQEKELHKIESEIKLFEREFKYNKNENVETYLKGLTYTIKELYPNMDFTISIELVGKCNAQNPSESEVVILDSYPDKEYNMQMYYRIKDNIDLSSIVKDSKAYFFVSDLHKYDALKNQVNINRDFLQRYNTSIVVPIQKNDKENEKIIGFLCIRSSQKLGNVKKNRKLMDVVKLAASRIYDCLKENELIQETIKIKK